MRKFGFILTGAAAALVAAMAAHPAHAIPANGSFGFVPLGTVTVTPGPDITLGTTSKTVPASESINQITSPFLSNPNNLGLTLGGAVTLSSLTLQVPAGILILPTPLDVMVHTTAGGGAGGTLTFRYTVEQTTSLAGNPGAQFSLLFVGTLFADTTNTFDLGQSADLSESCTQTGAGATINCSDVIDTPAQRTIVPEPASLALLGAALVGLGFVRNRRRKAA